MKTDRKTGKKAEYVLITSSNFPEGGPGASYLNQFCKGLKINGAIVRVYLLKGNAFGSYRYNGPRHAVTPEGIAFTYLGFRQRPGNFVLKLLDQSLSFMRLHILLFSLTLGHRNCTVLLYNSDLFFNLPIGLIARISGLKLVKYSAEIIDKSQYSPSLLGRMSRAAYMANFKYLNRLADKLIVFSHYLKEEFLGMGIAEERIIVQPNLTDFEFWKPGKTESMYTIGYSGAPYMKDGLHDLLEALGLLSARGLDLSLIVIGDATFGRTLIPGLKEECARLGIMDRVTFTGLVSSSEVKGYLSHCMILAVTRPDTIQTRAGFPTKLGEYFALGKPVLATRFGDMEKYFRDGHDIVFAECDDPPSIAERIEWMLSNPEQTRTIADQGHETARQLLDYRLRMKRIMELLAS